MGGDAGQQIAAGLAAFQQRLQQGRGTATLPVAQSPAVQRVQQAVRGQVEQPIPQDLSFAVDVPVPEVERPAVPTADVERAEFPAPVGQAVLDLPEERAPTEAERLQRVVQMTPTELAFFGAEPDQAANVALGQLRQEEAKLAAKTAQQETFNKQFVQLLGQGDAEDIAAGRPGLGLRSATINPVTGNISFNLGKPTSEEQKRDQRARLQAAILEDLRTGQRKPWQTQIALQADTENPITLDPSELEANMKNIAGNLIAASVGSGMAMGDAVERVFDLTGVIPDALEGFLPANISNEATLTQAREVARIQSQLTPQAENLREVQRANEAQRELTRRIIDFRALQRPTAEQSKTRTAHLTAAQALGSLVDNFDKAFVGPVRGRVGSNILDIFGQLKNGEQILRTQIAKLKVNTIQAITGAAMGETEAVRIMATIPDLRDTANVFLQKLRQNAIERADLLRIHEAMVEQGGRRFRGDIKRKTIMIGGDPVDVVDVEASLRVLDPSMLMNFSATEEGKAGIAVMRDGTVTKIDPGTGEITEVQTQGSATTSALAPTPEGAAAAAAPPGTTGDITPAGQAVMERIRRRLQGR